MALHDENMGIVYSGDGLAPVWYQGIVEINIDSSSIGNHM